MFIFLLLKSRSLSQIVFRLQVVAAIARGDIPALEALRVRVDRLYKGTLEPGQRATAHRPLIWAVHFAKPDVVKWLVHQGSDVNFFLPCHPDHWEQVASHGNCFSRQPDPRCLIDDFNWATWRNGDGPKPVLLSMSRGHLDLSRLLVSLGATFRSCEVPWNAIVRRRDLETLSFSLSQSRENKGQPRDKWIVPFLTATFEASSGRKSFTGECEIPNDTSLEAITLLMDAVQVVQVNMHDKVSIV